MQKWARESSGGGRGIVADMNYFDRGLKNRSRSGKKNTAVTFGTWLICWVAKCAKNQQQSSIAFVYGYINYHVCSMLGFKL